MISSIAYPFGDLVDCSPDGFEPLFPDPRDDRCVVDHHTTALDDLAVPPQPGGRRPGQDRRPPQECFLIDSSPGASANSGRAERPWSSVGPLAQDHKTAVRRNIVAGGAELLEREVGPVRRGSTVSGAPIVTSPRGIEARDHQAARADEEDLSPGGPPACESAALGRDLPATVVLGERRHIDLVAPGPVPQV